MPRPREPIDLLLAKGNKHLTRDEIENRRSSEFSAPVGDVSSPDYLPDKLKAEFEELAEKLVKINIMTELDVDLLARYLLSKQAYLALTNRYMKALSTGSGGQVEKLSTMQDKAFKQCQSAARELGLTISSRCKLVIPKKEEPPASKWDRFKCG
ncbi:MAG: phage terminase small subunit P27 family [Leptolinea sp.]|nr:phage terminase small subunit P27 family [Leptolinea sp.]